MKTELKRIRLWDKEFEISYPYEEIQRTIRVMAEKMRADLEGKNPLFICILNGAFMFGADLLKELELPDAEISFLKVTSYAGLNSTGKTKELIGLDEDLTGRIVVILEDIVDSGLTMASVTRQILNKGAKEVRIACLLFKPGALQTELTIDYTGIIIKNDFVVGYGLDYDRRGRNFKDIYTLIS
jgi:hypoxanthine phosphoribosyltransferase